MVQISQNLSKLIAKYLKRSQRVQNDPKRFHITQNGLNWSQMAPMFSNVFKPSQIIPNGPKWS